MMAIATFAAAPYSGSCEMTGKNGSATCLFRMNAPLFFSGRPGLNPGTLEINPGRGLNPGRKRNLTVWCWFYTARYFTGPPPPFASPPGFAFLGPCYPSFF
jgi:hypothetical protein